MITNISLSHWKKKWDRVYYHNLAILIFNWNKFYCTTSFNLQFFSSLTDSSGLSWYLHCVYDKRLPVEFTWFFGVNSVTISTLFVPLSTIYAEGWSKSCKIFTTLASHILKITPRLGITSVNFSPCSISASKKHAAAVVEYKNKTSLIQLVKSSE